MSSLDDPGVIRDIPDNLDDYSFEEWCDLHRSDPEKFEACRLKILNDMIESAPQASRPRLRGLLFQMEGEARRSKSQLGYNLRLSSMMMEMLDQMREQMYLLVSGDASEVERAAESPSARVIPFARRNDSGESR